MAARKWTLEQRQAASEAIHRWKPWEKSTGPRSKQGKERASRNAWKGGFRPAMRELAKATSEFFRDLNHREERTE